MIAFPNAKINIGLNITEKRPDGFHNLVSCFYPIDWSDVLEIIPSPQLQLSFTGVKIPGNPRQNLCLKAFQLLKNDFNIPSVQIHLHKVIPIGAGLGGGSSDGAYALMLLNELFQLQLSDEALENYARKLGSDCAFFIKNTPVIATQKGDKFEEISVSLTSKYLLLVHPKIHIPTAEAYSNVTPKFPDKAFAELINEPISNWKNSIANDFEASIFSNHNEIEALKNKMYSLGAEYASMSGSGSSVYGIFENETSKLVKNFEGYTVWNQTV